MLNGQHAAAELRASNGAHAIRFFYHIHIAGGEGRVRRARRQVRLAAASHSLKAWNRGEKRRIVVFMSRLHASNVSATPDRTANSVRNEGGAVASLRKAHLRSIAHFKAGGVL